MYILLIVTIVPHVFFIVTVAQLDHHNEPHILFVLCDVEWEVEIVSDLSLEETINAVNQLKTKQH